MAEKLIALRDIEQVKAGDHFEAPDRIFVALGWARVDTGVDLETETAETGPPRRTYRRQSRTDPA